MKYDLKTRCIHGECRSDDNRPFGAITTPIFQSATFAHPGIGHSTGYDYSRESNPTRSELEHVMSSLEGAADTVACSSGMAAVSLCMELFEPGSHFVCTNDLYGGSVRMFQQMEERRGFSFTYVDTADAEAAAAAVTPRTRALYIETPSNPTMRVTDLAEMKRLAEEHHLLLIVDNTFLSPYLQTPIALGADLVIHSGTKFLGGHNDVLAGFVCAARKELAERIRYLYKSVGSCLAPFDSFLMLRSIKTLAVRMECQQKNALTIARWLKQHQKVSQVYYIGLPEHPGHEIQKRQASGFGGMISFRTDTAQTARDVLSRVRLISYAESLGGVESLITYPMLQTHGDVPVDVREALGITDTFLRLSVGIESVEDLIADLEQALA